MRFHGIRVAVRIPRFSRRQIEREVDDELAFHLARRAAALRAAGLSEADADAEAKRRFGGIEQVRAECIEVEVSEHRRETLMSVLEHLWSDLRWALRSLRRAPGFTVVALTTLVLGIASVTSIFSFFNAVYFGTLPYRGADRIVALSEERGPGTIADYSMISLRTLPVLREPMRSFERVAAYDLGSAPILAGSEPQWIATLAVDSSFFPIFGLQPQLGRLPSADEIVAGARVAMISDVLWRTHYGQDPSVVGQMIALNADRFRIVGVLPPDFRFPNRTDVITPLRETPDSTANARTSVGLIARLRPGATIAGARAEVEVIATRLRAADPVVYRRESLRVRDEMLDRRARQFLPMPSLFLGAGFFLLLIACTNVTNLFYVRAAQRRGEMAIRASLGAARGRLIRHAMTESLVVSAVAAVLGTVAAQWLVRLWLHFVPTEGFPSWFHVTVDLRVLAFAVGITALVTIVVGLAPAREGTRFDLVRALKAASDFGSSSDRVTRGSRRGLVLQLGLSMALFISAALLVRSFGKLTTIDLGYPADRIATVHPFFDRARYADGARTLAFATEIASRAAAMPGVSGTAVRGYYYRLSALPNASATPDAGPFGQFDSRLIPDGDSSRAVRPSDPAVSYVVSDGYFALLGLTLRAGRRFAPEDANGTTPVAVIGAYTANLLWGSSSPVGRTIQLGRYDTPLTVVGVVDDVRDLRGGSRGYRTTPRATIYLSTRQGLTFNPEILARGSGDVLELHTRIVGLVRAADPMLILSRDITLASQLSEAFLVTRVFGGVIAALASAALALSIIGIYGVVAFGIAQRTRELGIRMALGGTVDDVMRLIMTETMRFVSIGLVVGVGLALALGRVLRIMLYGVSPLDPVTYAAVGVLFAGVALIACWWPARRVTRIDPLAALRAD